jgi:tetratricopeptide (TPR) repeat protein
MRYQTWALLLLNVRPWDQAEQFYTECLQIRQLLGDQSGIAITQHNLGHMFYAQGESERAYALLSESLTISRHLK